MTAPYFSAEEPAEELMRRDDSKSLRDTPNHYSFCQNYGSDKYVARYDDLRSGDGFSVGFLPNVWAGENHGAPVVFTDKNG